MPRHICTQTIDLKDRTVFCAELLAHPLDIVIPYCPVDGKCLFSKITKSTSLSKQILTLTHVGTVYTITTLLDSHLFCKYSSFYFSIAIWLRTQYLSEDVQVFWHNKQQPLSKILKYNDQPVHYKKNSVYCILL
jgi:hypothetical protein